MESPASNIAYKYCSTRGVEILEKLELKITPPNEFNDPFEFTPFMFCSNPHQYAKYVLKQKANLKRLYLMLVEDGRFSRGFKEFKRLSNLHRSEMVEEFSSIIQFGLASAQKDQLDHISAKFGVLCMSKKRDSILMWGHYCSSHQGIVIGFDTSSGVFRAGKGLRSVEYVKKRVPFDSNWKPGSLDFQRYDDQLIFSKNEEWKYEGEMRMFMKLSNLKQRALDNGRLGHFQRFPPEAVFSVALGVRCSKETEQKVRAALRQTNLSHVKLERAVLHDSEFSLKFEAA